MQKNKIIQITLFLLGWFSLTYAQGNWELMIPSPTSNQMVSLYFVDDQTGWSVGEYGTILKTIDGGNTWRICEIDCLTDLIDVYFPTEQIGYIVGEDGIILKSVDGGESWTIQENAYSNNLQRIRFTDSETGWAIGEKGLILHTTNGGETWQQQATGSGEDLYGITLVGQEKVIVVGNNNTILLTENKGTDWESVYFYSQYYVYNYRDVYFANDSTGWIGGENSIALGCILCTLNGGKSWSDKSSANEVIFNGTLHTNVLSSIQQIWFSEDMQTGVCFTALPNWRSNTDLLYYPVYTYDGGSSWYGHVDGYREQYKAKSRFQFLTDSCVIATGYGGDFRFSENGGRTWYYKDVGNRYWQNFIIFPDGSLHILAPEGENYSSRQYVSHDKGDTWIPYTSTISLLDGNQMTTQIMGFYFNRFTLTPEGRLYGCVCITPETKYSLLYSDDFGKSYHEIRRNLEMSMSYLAPDTLSKISLNEIEVEANGYQPILDCWYSFDGGATIQNQTFMDIWNDITPYGFSSSTTQTIHDKYFFNGRVGFLVGTDGNILRTEDTGQSWANIYSGVVENLWDIEFIDHQTGFVVGEFGRVLKSEDGGMSWRKTNSGTQEDIYCIAFINEDEGWIGTESGMRYTEDGGETWQGVPLRYQHGAVYNIQFDQHHNGYAFSNGGYSSQSPGTYVKFQRMTDYATGIDGIANSDLTIPKEITLSPNYPNPFNSRTTIEYNLPKQAEVNLKIFDIQGRLVRSLVNQAQESGAHSVIWDGVSDSGSAVSSGVYIYQLECGEQVKRQKLLLMK